MNTHTIYHGELIGLDATITHATNTHQQGYQGKIIDETKNTIIFAGNKTFLKKTITLQLHNQIVDGTQIIGRSEDRIKK